MTAHVTRLGRATACATLLLLAPSVGHAAMLVPGAQVAPDLLTDVVLAGDIEATAVDLAFGTSFYTGSLTAAVARNAGGTLDFYYQITNNGSSIHSLTRNTNSLFAVPPTTFTTDVFYRTDDAGLPGIFEAGDVGATPNAVDRGLDGQVVGFDFKPGAASINPTETSMILVIRTNATTFTDGFSSLLNGLPASVLTFGPGVTAPVPEPASLLLLSSAFSAAGYMARHRAKKRKRASV